MSCTLAWPVGMGNLAPPDGSTLTDVDGAPVVVVIPLLLTGSDSEVLVGVCPPFLELLGVGVVPASTPLYPYPLPSTTSTSIVFELAALL